MKLRRRYERRLHAGAAVRHSTAFETAGCERRNHLMIISFANIIMVVTGILFTSNEGSCLLYRGGNHYDMMLICYLLNEAKFHIIS